MQMRESTRPGSVGNEFWSFFQYSVCGLDQEPHQPAKEENVMPTKITSKQIESNICP